jgi:hypothetical protein
MAPAAVSRVPETVDWLKASTITASGLKPEPAFAT